MLSFCSLFDGAAVGFTGIDIWKIRVAVGRVWDDRYCSYVLDDRRCQWFVRERPRDWDDDD